MPVVITAVEYLSINSVPSATPAWRHRSLRTLRQEADQRGADRLIPHAAGVQAFQRRRTVTKKLIPFVIFGDFDLNGAAIADAEKGLLQNIDALNSAWVAPTGTGDGTRLATWHPPGGLTTRTAYVHVEGLDIADGLGGSGGPGWVYAVLRLSIPAGRFT